MELKDSSRDSFDETDGSLDDIDGSLGLPRRSIGDSDEVYRFHDLKYTKLEVFSAQQIAYVLRFILGFLVLAIGATVFSCLVIQLMFTTVSLVPVPKSMLSPADIAKAEPTTGKDLENFVYLKMRVDRMPPNRWYNWFTHALFPFSAFVLLVAGIAYLIRLQRAGRHNISHEQLFTVALIFVSLFYFNIPIILGAISYSLRVPDLWPKWLLNLEQPFRVLKDALFGPFLAFYVLCNVHTYRILDPHQRLGFRFFAPKVALVLVYSSIRVVSYFAIKLETSEVPFVTAVFALWYYGRYYFWRAFPIAFALVLAITIYEAILVAVILWQGYVTMIALRRAPYMINRTKHVGFRFFTYLNTVFFVSHFVISSALALGRPAGNYFFTLAYENFRLYMLFVPWKHSIGPALLVMCYVLISAFVNLPHDSLGVLKGWFVPSELGPSSSKWSNSWSGSNKYSSESPSFASSSNSRYDSTLDNSGSVRTWFQVDKDYELNQQIVEPVTYRKRESDSDSSLELKANCFTMQTHVFMFNFAWYVYYYGTPKFERLKEQDQVFPFKFTISESIQEKSTDSLALIINGTDRIIVSFKGSTSFRNLRTSLAAYHERLKNVVPTNIDGNDEHERLNNLFAGYFEAAKIHKGFAVAYASIAHRVMSGIKRLHDERPRPIFLTGHSLGGALATICSLDIWLKLRISRRSIFVSTFGSPRVGNEAFKRVYNSVIVLHWRVVVSSDMIAKLPKGMYRHVGKKATLTQHGDLFIDPSALELKLWSGTAGIGYHRKASYLLAMQSWCLRHHKRTYSPKFWEFPVRDEDRERFVGARFKDGNEELEEAVVNSLNEDEVREFMGTLNQEGVDDEILNKAAVEKWGRLALRLLLREKSSGMAKKRDSLDFV